MVDDERLAALRDILAGHIGPRRLRHSLAVMNAARDLARRHCPQLEDRAAVAGLLHDNAKGLPDEDLLANARRFDIELSAIEARHPALLHGKVGAALLTDRFGVDDREVIRAVADHVTGRVGMGLLSIVLFVADQAADDRSFAGVEELRRVSGTDLYRAAYLVAKHKLRYSISRDSAVEPTTVAVYNELRDRIELNGHD